jgi:transposase
MPETDRTWTAAARFEAVIVTAAMDEAAKSAWCRSHGIYPTELEKWRISAVEALASPQEARATPQQTRHSQRRIKELERDLKRKEKALAETAALLVLSKKLSAIYGEGADDWSGWKIARKLLSTSSKPMPTVLASNLPVISPASTWEPCKDGKPVMA